MGMTNMLSDLEKTATAFDLRDINTIIDRSITFLAKRYGVENVVWVKAGHFLPENLSEAESQLSEDAAELGACNYLFTGSADDGWKGLVSRSALPWVGMEKGRKIKWMECENNSICFIPLHSTDLGESIGQMLLPWIHGQEQRLEVSVFQAFVERHLTYALQFEAARSLSFMDPLTQLYNQRYLTTVLNREISRSQRSQKAFSVLFCDIDNFKTINDQHGHLVGSVLITQLGEIIRDNLRTPDYGFRCGGDEFVILLSGAMVDEAEFVAERLRRDIADKTFLVNGVSHRLTISVGVAAYPEHGTTKEQILYLADKAMYYGKRKSKNIVYRAS